jgi:hypothetical protein
MKEFKEPALPSSLVQVLVSCNDQWYHHPMTPSPNPTQMVANKRNRNLLQCLLIVLWGIAQSLALKWYALILSTLGEQELLRSALQTQGITMMDEYSPTTVTPPWELWHVYWKISTTQHKIVLCAGFQLLWKVFETAQARIEALTKLMDCTAFWREEPRIQFMSSVLWSWACVVTRISLRFSYKPGTQILCVLFTQVVPSYQTQIPSLLHTYSIV